ncbi:hypothetical protein D3C80_1179510 [compost metagenome]
MGVCDHFIAFVGNANQAIGKDLLLIQRATGIKRTVDPVVAAGAKLDLASLLAGRALGDHVDQPARLVLPIEHRRGAFEHLDALQGVGVDLRCTAQAAGIRHVCAVQVQRGRGKATAGDFVGNGVAVGEAARGQPRRVAQCLGQVARALGLHLVGGDHVDGLGYFQDRCIGLGACRTAGGDIAVYRAIGRFHGGAGNAGAVQLQRRGIADHGQQRVAAIGLAQHLQFAAHEQLAQAGLGTVAAMQARRAQRLDVGRLEGDRHPCRCRELGERRGQRAGRDVERGIGAGLGDGGLGNHHRGQRGRQGDAEQCAMD